MKDKAVDDKRILKVLKDCLRKYRAILILFLAMTACSLAVFLLYNLPMEAFFYLGAISLFILLVSFVISYIREYKMAGERQKMLNSDPLSWKRIEIIDSLEASDYVEMVYTLRKMINRLTTDYDARMLDMKDYYTTWVHQIKTPIAVIRLNMDGFDDKSKALLESELFRIEQYSDMALQYIRLDCDSNDLVIKEYPLDELIRESIHKYANLFIARKLRLVYEGVEGNLITDKKWFGTILDQLLSNAIKYTRQGFVSISLKGDKLFITDTGIGIAKEDMTRIFEKGYTGNNGRLEKKSSGLGLYLSKKAADLLALDLSVESKIGEGTSFIIDLTGHR